MIKKYKKYIKNLINNLNDYKDLNDETLYPLLKIARKQNKPYELIKILNCSGYNLKNLNGIEHLINLEYLDCSNNLLTTLDGIENLHYIKYLKCYSNNFSIKYKVQISEYFKKEGVLILI